jgi:hypothetical protein
MVKGNILFGHVQARLPWAALERAVGDVQGDRKVQRATCRSHFLVLLLALLRRQHSLRDIENSLSGRQGVLARYGVGSVDRSSVSYANRHRPVVAVEAMYAELLAQAQCRAGRHRFRFRERVVTLDATEIPVSRRLFEWARCSPQEAGVKLHLFLDHSGRLPCLVEFATWRESELSLARRRAYAKGTVLCFDRGYFDSAWFADLTAHGVVFVTRLPSYVRYRVLHERPPHGDGILADQLVRFSGPTSGRHCTVPLRLITFYDAAGDRVLQFVTNQRSWSALTICHIYKDRWQIELFFKWLKQNLKLTHFYGHSESAVRWQVLVALCLYLLLTILKIEQHQAWSLRDWHRRLDQYLFDPLALSDLGAMSNYTSPT